MGSKHRQRTRFRLKQYHFIPRYLTPLSPPGSLVWPRQVLPRLFASHPIGGLRPAIRSSGSRLYQNPYDWEGAEWCSSMGSSRSHTPPSPSSLTWRSEFPSTVLRVFVATGNRRISRYAARQMLFPKWVPTSWYAPGHLHGGRLIINFATRFQFVCDAFGATKMSLAEWLSLSFYYGRKFFDLPLNRPDLHDIAW